MWRVIDLEGVEHARFPTLLAAESYVIEHGVSW